MSALSGPLTAIRTVGGVLPADVLARVVAGTELKGLGSDDYRLEIGLTPREAANRAWAVLASAWRGYRAAVAALPETDRAVGLTRDKWLGVLFRELGFGRLRATPAGGLVIEGKAFPISHCHDTGSGLDVPMHLLGWNVDLDKRTPGVPGAADRAPHAMVQEYLNRADTALWAFVSNGKVLRLLRDSSSLIGQSYVEFDLESMFDGELFSDFVVLFLTCHETRFAAIANDDATPADCWLERWRTYAAETGTRALNALSPGVAAAIAALGTGFARGRGNTIGRRLADDDVRLADYHHALLRLVYRLLFCFVAEDRGVLLDPSAPAEARLRYADWFATGRLRAIARRRRGTNHTDLYDALRIVLDGLGQVGGRPELGLPGIGGLFVNGPVDALLDGQVITNEALLTALRSLTVVQPVGGGPRRVIDYRNLGAEELGSVYESLLELVPRFDAVTETFTLDNIAGNDRKTSGSYYTPTSLIDCLLDSALDPLLDEAERAADPAAALLALTVCDPACGSGHFLVAAARRLASRLAKVRSGDGEPTLVQEREAMHDVVAHCIFGVDLNPLAAELAKVSLWLESVQPGRPLSFLSAHIKVGNSLLGTTPALLAAGIPDEAFTALEGDDKKHVASLKKRNKLERPQAYGEDYRVAGSKRAATVGIFDTHIDVSNRALAAELRSLESLRVVNLGDLQAAEQRLADFEASDELRRQKFLADAWCAAFVAVKQPGRPELTNAVLTRAPDPVVEAEAAALAQQYRFFHWHVEFPQIFSVPDSGPANTTSGWTGGFSCVLGNPPWERIKLQEQEFFAARDPEIAEAPNAAARKQKIRALIETNPALHQLFLDAARRADGESMFLRRSGRYPLCGRGDINTYAVFAENNRNVLHPQGRLGVILPTGIATDATTQHYFKDLVTTGSLISLFDFENRRPLFEAVDSRMKFCLLTLTGPERPSAAATFAFFLHHPDQLLADDARFTLTPEELTLLNPNTGTCPVFRTRRDAEITLGIYRRVPILIREGDPDGNPWGLSFMRMIDMSNDSHLFRTRAQLEDDGWTLDGNVFTRGADRMLPLYEAKMIHHYDHRWATYDGDDVRDMTEAEHADPHSVAMPRYWVAEPEVTARLAGRWDKPWLLGFRDICRATDERTMIASAFPIAAVGNNLPIATTSANPSFALLASLSSLALDFVARVNVGGTHMNFFIVQQLPVPAPTSFAMSCAWYSALTVADWIGIRIEELAVTSFDMPSITTTHRTAPAVWVTSRRVQLRAELDACFFHLYGCIREEVDYILDTFPIVRRKDEAQHGEYRTKRLILEAFDAMHAAIDTGTDYVGPLDPPPGHGPRHPAATVAATSGR